jgi:hypothetical protein
LGFLGGQEGHGASLKAFGWDAEHPADHGGVLGVPHGGVGEQGSDCREPQVACPGAVVALGLEMLEKRGDHRLVEVVPLQR